MVKPLTFKGDKKPKKRKRPAATTAADDDNDDSNRPSPASKPDSSQPPATTPSTESTWTSADLPTDIAGPILLAFATPVPYCLACDANGKVFFSRIENIYTEDGSTGDVLMATAEPHDVRQVWVACKVGGMEGWGFRGHHGR
jgi:protein FRG1